MPMSTDQRIEGSCPDSVVLVGSVINECVHDGCLDTACLHWTQGSHCLKATHLTNKTMYHIRVEEGSFF